MATRRALMSAALAIGTGCSFIGARVPDRPPVPERCPGLVVAADVGGTLLLATYSTLLGIELYKNDSYGAMAAVIVLPVSIPMTVLYAVSSGYGLRNRSDCERLKREEVAAQALAAAAAPPSPPAPPARANVVGETPLHCFESTSVLGACFFTEAECADAATAVGHPCEQRSLGFCLDVTSGADRRTRCAPTLRDCEGRRRSLALDNALVVSTCSQYTVAAPAPAP